MGEEQCDVCLKKKVMKYRAYVPDGYIECCSKKCAIKEVKSYIEEYIEEIK